MSETKIQHAKNHKCVCVCWKQSWWLCCWVSNLSFRAATPGSSFPSKSSKEAPPPVLQWVTWKSRHSILTKTWRQRQQPQQPQPRGEAQEYSSISWCLQQYFRKFHVSCDAQLLPAALSSVPYFLQAVAVSPPDVRSYQMDPHRAPLDKSVSAKLKSCSTSNHGDSASASGLHHCIHQLLPKLGSAWVHWFLWIYKSASV